MRYLWRGVQFFYLFTLVIVAVHFAGLPRVTYSAVLNLKHSLVIQLRLLQQPVRAVRETSSVEMKILTENVE